MAWGVAMTRFQIRPKAQPQWAEIFTTDASKVLPVVQRLERKDADVFRNGAYAYSVRLGSNGIWSIYRRENPDVFVPGTESTPV